MCRIYGFRSVIKSGVHDSLIAADNALGRQSERHPDGWGVAYYMDRFPHVIRNTKKALDDRLFSEVSAVVQTRTLLAHIRQATVGQIGILNCHPFQFGPWTFAHNGNVEGYGEDPEVTEAVRELVDPRWRSYVLGSTDSETCFFIFLSRLSRHVEDVYHAGIPRVVVLRALGEMVRDVIAVADPRAPNPDDPCKMTFVLTNGSTLVGYRHRKELFFSTHKTRCPDRDVCPAFEEGRCESAVEDGLVKHLVVTSERVSVGPNVWTELRDGEYVSVDHGMHFTHGTLNTEIGRPLLPMLSAAQ
ncbi:MAG: class II glutamine amidotransferase [Myxococcota bacterium]